MPRAPQRKWWSIRLWPSSPELLPSPPGHTSVAERISSQVEFNVDAHRNTTFARYSVVAFVSASITRTPPARLRSRSKITSVAMALVRSVNRPVFIANGSVDACVLKYEPEGHPSAHALRYWQRPRPGSGCVRLATRPGIRRRVVNFAAMREATDSSTQFNGIGGWNGPSGSCGRCSIDPEMPACFSTWSYHGAMSA